MKKDQVLGIIRHILTFFGGLLVTKGIIDEAGSLELVGSLVTAIGGVWSVFSKKSV
jgi:hypothetical protein